MIKTINKGTILIAKPVLYDDNFDRSVIVLTDHNEKGSVGFIQNKPTGHVLKDLIVDLNCDFKVFKGGPVEEDSLYYVHSRPDLISNSKMIHPGLFWSGNFEDVKHALNNGLIKNSEIRFYLGYSGWSENQLYNELENDSWFILKEKFDLSIFEKDKYSIWQKMIKVLGGTNLIWINTPFDPTMN